MKTIKQLKAIKERETKKLIIENKLKERQRKIIKEKEELRKDIIKMKNSRKRDNELLSKLIMQGRSSYPNKDYKK